MSAPTFSIQTASPAHSASSSDSIQPIHHDQDHAAAQPQGAGQTEQGHSAMNLGAKGFLMKKMAAAGQSFQSPTDQMVSPCTKKLSQSKQRHFTKGKPLSLSNSFQQQAAPKSKLSGLGQSSQTQENENSAPF